MEEQEGSVGKYKAMCDGVYKISHEIFDEIVTTECGVRGMAINIYSSKLADYDSADPKSRKEILGKIIGKYKVDKTVIESMQDYPIALIALYILEQKEKLSAEAEEENEQSLKQ